MVTVVMRVMVPLMVTVQCKDQVVVGELNHSILLIWALVLVWWCLRW
jgi:hypothetical protein